MIAGITGLAIAVYILAPGATYDHNWLTLILAGAALGLLLYFVRPLLYLITLPLELLPLIYFLCNNYAFGLDCRLPFFYPFRISRT